MNDPRWDKMKRLFAEASEMAPAARSEFLSRQCAADPKLKAQVQALLTAQDHPDPSSNLRTNESAAPDQETRVLTSVTTNHSRTEDRFMPGVVFAGRYRIISLIGKGGMGEVYRAYDLQLNQTIALKLLPVVTEDALDRFRNEVRTARQVTHPNVCRVYDIGDAEGTIYLTMEYIDGEDLASLLLRIGRLPEDKAVEITRQICAGLNAAHEKNVLHRDLKPGNIMLDGRGHARITDFGLATLAEAVEGHEALHGTPLYMAPEQLAGKEATARSDIYALGLVLFEMFTGRRPFETSSYLELQKLRTNTPVPNPSNLVSNITPHVEKAILRCLESDPRQRPNSPLAVVSALSGKDPVSAALSSGLTPSPADVAAAGSVPMMPASVALTLLILTIVGIIAVPVWTSQIGWLSRQRLELTPDYLAQNARHIADALGYGPPADSTWGFQAVPAIAGAANHGVEFWYRQANCVFKPDLPTASVPPGRVTPENPHDACPGDLIMFFNLQGKLIRLRGLAPAALTNRQPDWDRLFDAAGFDRSRLQPADPGPPPPTTLDTQNAWTLQQPDNAPPTQIAAATWRGLPVYFAIGFDPYFSSSATLGRSTSSQRAGYAFGIAILGIVMAAALLLVRHNIRLGRGDRRGAFQIARFMFLLSLTVWILYATHRAGFTEINIAIMAIGWALFMAAGVWVLYLSLEPYVRRRWPQTLISIHRLMDGNYRDFIVSRDILVGMAAAVAFALLAVAQIQADIWRGSSPVLLPAPSALNSAGALLGYALYGFHSAVWSTGAMFTLVFILRLAVRRTWLAATTFVLLGAVLTSLANPPAAVHVPFTVLIMSLWMFVMLRVSALAFMICIAVGPLLGAIPFTFDFSKWYAMPTLLILTLLIAATIFAFRMTLPKNSLVRDEMLYS